ncbi:TetR/AcrR family transcriptional regulator [Pseudarthrobacter raffinosi]|uniref:TetR/AcrR family transcriptional regulator n=1 Tax=Pseudarthrobacter raffinosi TaxID=2953651 RepID=UPI00208F6073|nr:TetR/AcrR family transcriptional regulator [Pseudarthrobacter sp. MDT3-9]MCO4252139.1 TetR/AcrR family transcriptional regulator [Pseudarthrobacter sp. MDT3-9]
MPKNKLAIPREERSGEVLTAATELFLERGYAGTTMAEVGAAVGVSTNNVYWYFPSKDALFAAVMDRMLGREIRALEHELNGLDPLSFLIRGLVDMRPFRGLHQSMHHRMQDSDAVRESHDRFLAWIRKMVDQVIQENPGIADSELVADIVVSLFEGANAFDPPLRTAPEMIRFVLQSFLKPYPAQASLGGKQESHNGSRQVADPAPHVLDQHFADTAKP